MGMTRNNSDLTSVGRRGARMMAALVAVLLSSGVVGAQEASTGDANLYRAFYLETAMRDLDGAAALYAEIAAASEAADEKQLLARALGGRARCLFQLDRGDEARAAAERALTVEPELAEAKDLLARMNSAAVPAELELESRIMVLVQKLGGPERESASGDLAMIGDRAVPALAAGLRSKDVGVVASAAAVLIRIASEESARQLSLALGDPTSVFREVIADRLLEDQFLLGTQAVAAGQNIYAQIFAGFDATRRRLAIDQLASAVITYAMPIESEALQDLLERAATDSDALVRIELLNNDWPAEHQHLAEAVARDLIGAPNVGVRESVLKWIQGANPERRARMVEAIMARIADEHTQIACYAIKSLCAFDDSGFDLSIDIVRRAMIKGWIDARDNGIDHFTQAAMKMPAPVKEELFSAELVTAVAGALRRAVRERDFDKDNGRTALLLLERACPDADRWLENYIDLVIAPGSAGNHEMIRRARDELYKIIEHIGSSRPGELDGLPARGLAQIAEPDQRRNWIRSWLQIRPDFDVLMAAAADDDAEVRGYVYRFYVRPGDFSIKESERMRRAEIIAATPAGVFPLLDDDLRQSGNNEDFAMLALDLARALPTPDLAESIVYAHDHHRHPHAKIKALEALVAATGAGAIDLVLRDLGAEDHNLAVRALSLLVQLRGMEAVPDLVAQARARKNSGWIFNTQKPVTDNVELMDAYISAFTIEELSTFTLERLHMVSVPLRMEILKSVLATGRAELQIKAAEQAGGELIEELWPALVPLLESPNSGVRNAALAALQALRAHRQMKADIALLGASGASSALDEAIAMLASDDSMKRRAAAAALGALGDPSAVPALLNLMNDADEAVRESALNALEKLGK